MPETKFIQLMREQFDPKWEIAKIKHAYRVVCAAYLRRNDPLYEYVKGFRKRLEEAIANGDYWCDVCMHIQRLRDEEYAKAQYERMAEFNKNHAVDAEDDWCF